MKEQLDLFKESAQEFLKELVSALPQILGALLILIIGWIVAKLLKRVFIRLLKMARVSYLTEKAGIDQFLKSGGAQKDVVSILGTLMYWIIMLIVIMATLNSLKLTAAASLFNEIMLYIPRVIVAIVILIIGIYVARMVSQVIKTSLKSVKEKTSGLISRASHVVIIILTVFLVLGQLNIAHEIVSSAFQLLFGSICLALALAFGLGGREKAAEILSDFWKNEK